MIPDGESIQVEKGKFARIHNDILSALAVGRFTGSEYRCLLFLFRQTYGWQKKEDTISISQWAAGVGMEFEKRHNVWRTLQGLIDKKVICVRDNGNNRPKTWGFNKYIEQWDKSLMPQTVMPQDNRTVMQDDNSSNEPIITGDNRTVMPQDNKTVITQDTNKRQVKKEKEKAATHVAFLQDRDDDKDGKFTMQLIRDTNLFGYFKPDARGRASKLEESYTMDAIRKAVSVLVERHHAMLEKHGKGVQDAVAFLAKILAEDFQSPASAKFVNVEVRIAPNEHYPDGCVKRSVMSYAKAKAGGYKIVETMQ